MRKVLIHPDPADTIAHLLGAVQALQAQLAKQKASKWTHNRVAFVLRAVQDLQAAYRTEREEQPHV